MNMDTAMHHVSQVPWERTPHPGDLIVWTLLGLGTCFAVAVAHDLLAKKKRPRG